VTVSHLRMLRRYARDGLSLAHAVEVRIRLLLCSPLVRRYDFFSLYTHVVRRLRLRRCQSPRGSERIWGPIPYYAGILCRIVQGGLKWVSS